MFVAPDCPTTMPGFPFACAASAVCLTPNTILSELPLTDATHLYLCEEACRVSVKRTASSIYLIIGKKTSVGQV